MRTMEPHSVHVIELCDSDSEDDTNADHFNLRTVSLHPEQQLTWAQMSLYRALKSSQHQPLTENKPMHNLSVPDALQVFTVFMGENNAPPQFILLVAAFINGYIRLNPAMHTSFNNVVDVALRERWTRKKLLEQLFVALSLITEVCSDDSVGNVQHVLQFIQNNYC